MKVHFQENLKSYKKLLQSLSTEQFSLPLSSLFGSSIGQHVRHVLEFYSCLFTGIGNKDICYDNRKRDLRLETEKKYALDEIDTICNQLNEISADYSIKVTSNLSNNAENTTVVDSSVFRELIYAFDHSVHHQALIKVGLQELNCTGLDLEEFGIAPSTLKHRKACAQ